MVHVLSLNLKETLFFIEVFSEQVFRGKSHSLTIVIIHCRVVVFICVVCKQEAQNEVIEVVRKLVFILTILSRHT